MEMSFTSIKLLKYIHGLFKDVNAQKCYLLTAETGNEEERHSNTIQLSILHRAQS